ncbi:MAG: methyltransferase domain-containing protein [Coriobacteriia bacterium]|nr:methyltransferase domain-containing protein [Coriobacteriia bacterium]
MAHLKFDPAKLEKLNDSGRLDTLRPDAMWEALALDDPHELVEIGAGTGMFAAEFARRAPQATVYAVDTVDEMIAWMQENRAEVATGRVVPLRSEESSVPVDAGVADGVYMINLHHELAEPEAIYAEAFRILRPGGRVLVVDWAPVETPKGPPAAVRVSSSTLAEYLRCAGFSGVQTHEDLPWHSMVTAQRPEAAE